MFMFNILLNYFDALYLLFHRIYDSLSYYGILEKSMNYFAHQEGCAPGRLQKKLSDIRKLPHFDTRFEPQNCHSEQWWSQVKNAATLLPGQMQNATFCDGMKRA